MDEENNNQVSDGKTTEPAVNSYGETTTKDADGDSTSEVADGDTVTKDAEESTEEEGESEEE